MNKTWVLYNIVYIFGNIMNVQNNSEYYSLFKLFYLITVLNSVCCLSIKMYIQFKQSRTTKYLFIYLCHWKQLNDKQYIYEFVFKFKWKINSGHHSMFFLNLYWFKNILSLSSLNTLLYLFSFLIKLQEQIL